MQIVMSMSFILKEESSLDLKNEVLNITAHWDFDDVPTIVQSTISGEYNIEEFSTFVFVISIFSNIITWYNLVLRTNIYNKLFL